MIWKIDTIAHFLNELCEEILDVLNHRKETDNIFELVKECIAKNKEQADLEGFWMEENLSLNQSNKFRIEFHFKHINIDFTVEFTNNDDANGQYHATSVTPTLIVTKPLRLINDGVLYCSPHQKILYTDFFTWWVPQDYEDKCLPKEELLKEYNGDMDSAKKARFNSFYEKLSEREKNELTIANIDLQNLNDRKSDDCRYLINRVYDESISCVVTSEDQSFTLLKSILPSGTTVILYNQQLPLLSKQQWIIRTVRHIKSLYSSGVVNCYQIKNILCIVSLLTDYYNIPRNVLREVCCDVFDFDYPFDKFSRYLLNSYL